VADDLTNDGQEIPMRTSISNPDRRRLLACGVRMAGVAALGIAAIRGRSAAAKVPKSDFFYQDHAHDGKTCSQCRFFSAPSPSASVGTCAIVTGEISRTGWCTAFTPGATG
jgi:hypothetical protein